MTPRVTAFVSAYNSANWLRGRINNLIEQTLFGRGALEIVVVNSGSKDETATILKSYLPLGSAFKIITTQREGIYSAWNRGIKLASGNYVTNANADDKLHSQALERLADILDDGADVAYGDSWVTDTPYEAFHDFPKCRRAPYANGRMFWGAFSPERLKQADIIGACPMWRKSLHEQYGYFDESYLLSADYEMWLRLSARGVKFQNVPEFMSMVYFGNNATPANQEQSNMEARRALMRWR